jgi:hypothetical protein
MILLIKTSLFVRLVLESSDNKRVSHRGPPPARVHADDVDARDQHCGPPPAHVINQVIIELCEGRHDVERLTNQQINAFISKLNLPNTRVNQDLMQETSFSNKRLYVDSKKRN